MGIQRIVSLLPGCTEVVCALRLSDVLVGRSHACDFPPGIRQLPSCTEPRLKPEVSSAALDLEVKELLRNALSPHILDVNALRRLKPTLILTQLQCEACAISEEEVAIAVKRTFPTRPEIFSFSPAHLEAVWRETIRLADAMNVRDRGEALVQSARAKLGSIPGRISSGGTQPRVACIEWIEPLMAAGNWVPELVQAAGGLNLFGETGRHSPWMKWEALVAADPDVIVVMPCGYSLEKSRAEMSALTARPEWAGLSAVRNGRVALADGHQFFNRPGPRLVDSVEILAEILHPANFPPRLRGSAWEPFELQDRV